MAAPDLDAAPAWSCDQAGYSESDLETALIDKLEHFILELGKDFLFEVRQKRFAFDVVGPTISSPATKTC